MIHNYIIIMHEGENKCQVLEQLPAGTRFINFLVKCNGILITRKIEINQTTKVYVEFYFYICSC